MGIRAPHSSADRLGWRAPVGLAVLSGSILLYEILLTRIFSVVLLYHFAYLTISTALFGFSLGALLVHARPGWIQPARVAKTVGGWAAGYGLSIVASTLFLLRFRPAGMLLPTAFDRETLLYVAVGSAVSMLPFVLAGVCVATLLAHGRERIGKLYGYDLIGAALGAVAAVPLLEWLGAPQATLCAALLGTTAGALVASADGARHTRWPTVAAGLVAALGALSFALPILELRFTKGRVEEAPAYEGWNSFSRVTASESEASVLLTIDAGAATSIYPAEYYPELLRGVHTAALHLKAPRTGSREQEQTNEKTTGAVLVLGAGGGRELAAAAQLGFPSITGVELNPLIAELVTGRYRELAGGLYDDGRVQYVTAEGRDYLERDSDRYDALILTQVDTWAATAAGAFALSENHLYTREAFGEYVEHLADDGVLSITRWYFPDRPRELLRVLSLAIVTLTELGVTDPRQHLVVLVEEREAGRGTLLLKRSPFTEAELEFLREKSRRGGAAVALSPGGGSDPTFVALAQSRAEGGKPERFWREHPYDVTPPTDDRPFFFYSVRPGQLLASFRAELYRLPDVTNIGVFLLVCSVAACVALALAILVVPRWTRTASARGLGPALAYFAALGAGFMGIEVVLLQKLVLLLGHPTLALTVVLFTLLVGTGCGSFCSARVAERDLRARLQVWIGLLLVLGLGLAFGWPALRASLAGTTRATRIVASLIVVAPIGMLLGTCFPSGVRLLGARSADSLPWIWAANGAFSVLGSALAMLLAMNSGYRVTLIASLGLYAAALVLARRLAPRALAQRIV